MSMIAPPHPATRQDGRATSSSPTAARRLGAYVDGLGRSREVVCLAGAGGTHLVIDRRRDGGEDARLLAHLASDEPLENARAVAAMYLASAHRRRCRSVTAADLRLAAGEGALTAHCETDPLQRANGASPACELADGRGNLYRFARTAGSLSIPELRWSRAAVGDGAVQPASVRAVVGALERYEPILSLTRAAIARHADAADVSVAALRAEYDRAVASPIVLNRGLREAIQRLLASSELTMSEIAIRCGRVRRGERGALSGETSWLARRIGLVAEAGHAKPTPWVHSDVLALIARDGLSLSPHEVEV